MHKQIKTVLSLSALSIALLAAGCGGGSSDSTTSSGSGNMTVQGTAAKGIIKKGTVKVFEIGADGKPGASPVATGTTADDGTYSVPIPKNVLNFIVEVSAGPSATMMDEIKGEIAVPNGLKLRNVVALSQAQDGPYTGHVSPLTELAVKTAENAAGGLSTVNIAHAKEAVRTVLGFDPEQIKPVNSNSTAALSASEQEKSQSLILAAVSQMAASGAAGCEPGNLVCVIDKVTAPATMSSDKTTFNEVLRTDLVAAREIVASDSKINNTGKTVEEVRNDISLVQGEVGTTTTPVSGVDAAKQLFTSLRNTSQALQTAAATGGALDLSASAIKQDFSQSISPLDFELLDWMSLIPAGIDLFEGFKAGTATTPHKGVYRGYYPVGRCTVYSDQNATTVATSKDNAVSVGCSTMEWSVYNSYTYNPTTGVYSYMTVNKGITLIPNGTNAYWYKARAKGTTTTVTPVLNQPPQITQSAPATIGVYGDPATASTTNIINYTKSGSQITGFTVSGMMPARVDYFTGSAVTDHELWNMTFARTDEGSNVFKYALSGDFTSKKGGNTVGSMTLASGSFARVQEDGNGNSVDNGLKAVSLQVASEAGSSKIEGSLSLSDGKVDKSGGNYRPTNVSFTGTLSNKSAQVFSGTVTVGTAGYENFDPRQPVSSTNEYKDTIKIIGKLTVPNRPTLSVLVSTVSSIAADLTEIHAQYNDGTAVVNASVVRATAGDSLDVSSVSGVSFKVARGQTSADVMKDSAKVGEINLDTGIVTFSDGKFESLK